MRKRPASASCAAPRAAATASVAAARALTLSSPSPSSPPLPSPRPSRASTALLSAAAARTSAAFAGGHDAHARRAARELGAAVVERGDDADIWGECGALRPSATREPCVPQGEPGLPGSTTVVTVVERRDIWGLAGSLRWPPPAGLPTYWEGRSIRVSMSPF